MKRTAVTGMVGPRILIVVSLPPQHAGDMPAFLATDVSPRSPVGEDGVPRMNLVGGDQPSPTEFMTFRERYPANPCLGSVNEQPFEPPAGEESDGCLG